MAACEIMCVVLRKVGLGRLACNHTALVLTAKMNTNSNLCVMVMEEATNSTQAESLECVCSWRI